MEGEDEFNLCIEFGDGGGKGQGGMCSLVQRRGPPSQPSRTCAISSVSHTTNPSPTIKLLQLTRGPRWGPQPPVFLSFNFYQKIHPVLLFFCKIGPPLLISYNILSHILFSQKPPRIFQFNQLAKFPSLGSTSVSIKALKQLETKK